ncbi:MAG: ferredoxin [Cyclobacteriaceae bacterium]|nr:ferredoxin [Cyclobacteriaceae bacterium]
MVIITQQRDKCIGCNYCVELAYDRWRMSKKDGKATLIGGVNRKGFYTVKVREDELEENIKAAEACPVKIIHVKHI